MELTGCPEMSASNCQPTLRNIPEEGRPELGYVICHRGPSLRHTRCAEKDKLVCVLNVKSRHELCVGGWKPTYMLSHLVIT
jgi:hypothetical protein